MSSLRKHVPQKPHLERQQPATRLKHYGLLEKKKDYVLRAKDFHKKERRIQSMRTRIRNKNDDEFYHGMIKSQVDRDGNHRLTKRTEAYTGDELLLLKSQDIEYVRLHLQSNKCKIEKLLQLVSIKPAQESSGQHVKFIDSDEELQRGVPQEFQEGSQAVKSKVDKELAVRREKVKQLEQVLKELEMQRILSNGKGKRYKIGVDAHGNDIYKWRNERQK